MKVRVILPILIWCGTVLALPAQTTRVWSSNSDKRWSRNGNWTAANRPDTAAEIAEFGTGTQTNPQLNGNGYTVAGLRFSAAAPSYNITDDTSARTLKIGNASSGFIDQLSANLQTISLSTLAFQSNSTIASSGSGGLNISSRLTGNNRTLTFDATSTISVTGAITTGSGGLVKQGTGDLRLSGTNTYTGTTTINAGRIVADNSGIFSTTGLINLAAPGLLDLNNFAESVGQISGAGAISLGTLGTGQLTLSSGASSFAGSISGSGRLVIGSGATLTLGAGFTNTNLNITLAGGTLNLAGSNISFGSLDVTANSVIDFDPVQNSGLSAVALSFANTGLVLALNNWTDASDFFYSQTGYSQGAAPLNQVVFRGWTGSATKWLPYDHQVSPVPEPRLYGALSLGLMLGLLLRRRPQT